jgi:hypothetical protein
MQKHVFCPPNKILQSHVMILSLKSFHMPKVTMGYAKKKKDNILAKKA